MTDRPGTRSALALALITAGVLWLLVQVGFVPTVVIDALWRLWPLLLIGVGLDLLLPARRPAGVPFTAVAAALVLLAALLSPGQLRRSGQDDAVQVPLDGATTASVRLELPSSATVVEPASAGGSLLGVTTVGYPKAQVDVRGSAEKTVSVRPRSAFPRFGPSRWTVTLTPDLPLSLAVDGGSGSAHLALEALRLGRLELDLGSGSSSIVLPGHGGGYDVRLEGGSGATNLSVPTGASVDLDVELHSGATAIRIERGSDVRLTLRGGSGSVLIDVPEDAPVLLEVTDEGSGRLQVASFLARRSGSGDTGQWRSANYPNGERAIRILVADVGSGSIQIR